MNLHFSDNLSSPFLGKPDKNYKDGGMREREEGKAVEWGEGETRGQGRGQGDKETRRQGEK